MKSCIILCGGKSSRMGQDKGSMRIQKQPMIKHILSTLNHRIDEAIIVLNDENRIDKYKEFIHHDEYTYNLTFKTDIIKNKGPLSGILTGLMEINGKYGLILPCDSPYISKNYIETIFNEIDEKYDAVVPYHNPKDKLKSVEPLHSIYSINTINKINDLLKENSLTIKGLIEKIDTKFILIDNKKILKKEFKNLNSPKDL